jgi:hypothetical protein
MSWPRFFLNPKSEVGRGELAQSTGRECQLPAPAGTALRAAFGRLSRSARLSGFAVFTNTPQPSLCHLGSASCAISSPPTSEFGLNGSKSKKSRKDAQRE